MYNVYTYSVQYHKDFIAGTSEKILLPKSPCSVVSAAQHPQYDVSILLCL